MKNESRGSHKWEGISRSQCIFWFKLIIVASKIGSLAICYLQPWWLHLSNAFLVVIITWSFCLDNFFRRSEVQVNHTFNTSQCYVQRNLRWELLKSLSMSTVVFEPPTEWSRNILKALELVLVKTNWWFLLWPWNAVDLSELKGSWLNGLTCKQRTRTILRGVVPDSCSKKKIWLIMIGEIFQEVRGVWDPLKLYQSISLRSRQ